MEQHTNDPIDRAEAALRTLGITRRDQAERLISSWAHIGELTDQQRAAVLDRFAGTRCGTCHGLIEYVPVPPSAGPAWGPPFWRHAGSHAGSHAARPAVTS